MFSQQETSVIVIEHCIKCGTPFGIEETLRTGLLRSGNTLYCPNGHAQVFSKPLEKELEETKKYLKNAQQGMAFYKEQAEEKAAELKYKTRQLTSTRGQLTKTKNRIAKGLCPCCRRQFVNLHKHMENQHPDYTETETEEGQVLHET